MPAFYTTNRDSISDRALPRLSEISYTENTDTLKNQTDNKDKAEVMANSENYHRILAQGYQKANMMDEAIEEIQKAKDAGEKSGQKWEEEEEEAKTNVKKIINYNFSEFLNSPQEHLTLDEFKKHNPESFSHTVKKLKKIMVEEDEKEDVSEGWDSYKTRFPNIKMSFRTNQDGEFVRFTKG